MGRKGGGGGKGEGAQAYEILFVNASREPISL